MSHDRVSICALCGRYTHRDELVVLQYQTDPRLLGYVFRWMCLKCLEQKNKHSRATKQVLVMLNLKPFLTNSEKTKRRRLEEIEQALEKISA